MGQRKPLRKEIKKTYQQPDRQRLCLKRGPRTSKSKNNAVGRQSRHRKSVECILRSLSLFPSIFRISMILGRGFDAFKGFSIPFLSFSFEGVKANSFLSESFFGPSSQTANNRLVLFNLLQSDQKSPTSSDHEP